MGQGWRAHAVPGLGRCPSRMAHGPPEGPPSKTRGALRCSPRLPRSPYIHFALGENQPTGPAQISPPLRFPEKSAQVLSAETRS